MLFIIYINDICNVSEFLNFVFNADDNSFYTKHDIDILFNRTNVELKRLYNWLCQNKLLLNVDKSNYMLFSKKIKGNHYSYINNSNVKKWILGVYIDNKLKRKDHISNVCKKTDMCIAIFYKVKHILNTKSMCASYCTLILPHLTYCEVLGNNYKTNLMSLYLLQKRQFVLIVKVIS